MFLKPHLGTDTQKTLNCIPWFSHLRSLWRRSHRCLDFMRVLRWSVLNVVTPAFHICSLQSNRIFFWGQRKSEDEMSYSSHLYCSELLASLVPALSLITCVDHKLEEDLQVLCESALSSPIDSLGTFSLSVVYALTTGDIIHSLAPKLSEICLTSVWNFLHSLHPLQSPPVSDS